MAKKRAHAQGAAGDSDGEADADGETCEAFPTDGEVVDFGVDAAPVTGRYALNFNKLGQCLVCGGIPRPLVCTSSRNFLFEV